MRVLTSGIAGYNQSRVGHGMQAIRVPEMEQPTMKFSLSNLLLLVTLVAVGIGWWCDHRRLRHANARLNAEATELFTDVVSHGSAISAMSFPDGKLPPARTYMFAKPEDRADYLKTYGHILLRRRWDRWVGGKVE